MHFLARISHEGNATLAEFPDCPGCQTFARPPRTIDAQAADALAGWIEATLDAGDTIPRPSNTIVLRARERSLVVAVTPTLAVRVAMRWARDDADISQQELATRMGVSPQAVSRVERNAGTASVATLAKYASALGAFLDVRIERAGKAMQPDPVGRVSETPRKPYAATEKQRPKRKHASKGGKPRRRSAK